MRRRVVNHLRERLAAFEKRLVTEGAGWRRYRFDRAALDELAAVLASYWGHFRLADSFGWRQGLWRRFSFLRQYFELDESGKLTRRDKSLSCFSSARQQYRHYRSRFAGDVLFFQVGRFVEFYQPDDALLASRLGLEPMVENRRRARFGFPVAHSGKHLFDLLKAGQSVTLVTETGRRLERVKERVPRVRFECCGSQLQ